MYGFTPLHIAVTCVEKLESTRNVKSLLLRGASRDATDFRGKKPVDHISDGCPDHL